MKLSIIIVIIDMEKKSIDELKKDGVCTIPVLDEKERKCYNKDFYDSMYKFPEFYKNEKPPNKNTLFVKGSFGAFGNPSSFHNYTVRLLRLRVMKPGVKLLSDMIPKPTENKEKYYISQLIDRMSLRIKGTKLTPETWHRDETPNIPPSTDIFGGWINLDDKPQYFSCVKGTQISFLEGSGSQAEKKGFSKISPEQVKKERYEQRKSKITVPPGHLIIFYQNIVHEVLPVKQEHNSIRLYIGWCISTSKKSIIDYTESIKNNGIVQIPSKQKPPMYSKNHASLHLKSTIQWSKDTFDEKLLEHRKTTKSEYDIIPMFMKSLKEMKLSMYEEYENDELEILKPNRKWKIKVYNEEEFQID